MPRRLAFAVLLTCGLLPLSGCGDGADDTTRAEAVTPARAAAPSPSVDPARQWRNAITGLCKDLSGKVSGQQLTAGNDGKYTPAEVLAGEEAARPAVEAFDAGLAALEAPPEAAAADKALKDYLAMMKASVGSLIAAAEAGDQAALQQAFAAREADRLGPDGVASLTAVGLPESCVFRGSYS